MTLRWRHCPLEGYEHYLISENGDVWNGKLDKPPFFRQCGRQRYRYRSVQLRKPGRRQEFALHRLVWITFSGGVPDGHQVDHINRDRFDNRIENLRCVSMAENMANRGGKFEQNRAI